MIFESSDIIFNSNGFILALKYNKLLLYIIDFFFIFIIFFNIINFIPIYNINLFCNLAFYQKTILYS